MGHRRSSGPAGASPETAARASSSERRVALGELVVDRESLVIDADDAAALEVAEDAGAGDLQDIGHVGGRKMGERAEHEPTFGRRCVDAVEEDDV